MKYNTEGFTHMIFSLLFGLLYMVLALSFDYLRNENCVYNILFQCDIIYYFKNIFNKKQTNSLQLPLLQNDIQEDSIQSPKNYVFKKYIQNEDILNEKRKVYQGKQDKDIIYIKDLVKMYNSIYKQLYR